MAVHVGLLMIVLEIESADSLKDKRRVLKSLIERIRHDLKVSVAEVGFQNRRRTAEIAIAFVGAGRPTIEHARQAAERIVGDSPLVDVSGTDWEWL